MARKKKPSGDLITIPELDDMVSDVLQMEAYCKQFRELIQQKLEAGCKFENASLEPKRPMPKWSDEKEALRLLSKSRLLKRDEFEPRKIMPPGAFRKAVAKELKAEKPKQVVLDLLGLIKKESSGDNLVLK